MSSINIIVPLYHGEQYINRLINMFDMAARTLQYEYPETEVGLYFINDSPEKELSDSAYSVPKYLSCQFINPGYHQGIHGTRLYGLYHTQSDFVLFFDQDDKAENKYLLSQYEKLNAEDKSISGVVCNGIYKENRLIYSESRPMQMTFDRKALLEKDWNPLSPGQVLIRRSSIPVEQWGKYVMQHNLTDDWLLWFLMIHNGRRFILNPDVLYTHVEHASNSSHNWKEMAKSRMELLDILIRLKVLTHEEEESFRNRTEKYLSKYEKYIKLDDLLENADQIELVEKIRAKTMGLKISIYGMGIYGRELFRLLSEADAIVSYVIDQHADAIRNSEVPVLGTDAGKYPETDLVIVTPLFAYEEIVETSLKSLNCPKVRLDDFIADCLNTML